MNYFIDLEADGLYHDWEPEAATRIDCCCALEENPDIQDAGWYEDWDGYLREGSRIIGHNIFDYDLPMLKKFRGWDYQIMPDRLNGVAVEFVDTMLLSKLLNPDRPYPSGYCEQWKPAYAGQALPGPHSLDVWAYRLGEKKPTLVYGPKMGNVPQSVSIAQCRADILITRKLYYALVEEAKKQGVNLRKPLKIEQAVRHIMTQGATEGVWFDSDRAEELIVDLDLRMTALCDEVEPHLPPRELPASKKKFPPKQRFKKDGTPTAHAIRYFGDALIEHDGKWKVSLGPTFIPLKEWPEDRVFGVDTEPMKIGDNADIKKWLIEEYGWQPTLWNEKKVDGKKVKTSPKLQHAGKLCDDLERLSELVPIIKKICLFLSYRNRRSVIKSEKGTGWLHHPRLAMDHRLPADADTIGAMSFRMTHRVVANVPRKGSIYGEEMRSLFRAPPGMVMVGWDASQLEDRCKGHYCCKYPGGEEYVKKILQPGFDVHTENVENWDMPRAKTKNGHYALQYGCFPQKLADVLGISLELAEQYHEDWWSRNAPLAKFNEEVELVWLNYDKKYLPGIDGRLVPTRKKHALANAEFQSAGVIAMKWAMVYWWLEVRKLGIPAVQVIHYHDEAVAICPPEYTEKVGELGVWSIKKAGDILNFRVPLESEYKVGQSWLEVH